MGRHMPPPFKTKRNGATCGMHAAPVRNKKKRGQRDSHCPLLERISPQMTGGGIKKTRTERRVGCTPLVHALRSTSYSHPHPPRSLGLCDVVFDGGWFHWMMWHGQWALGGDVAVNSGRFGRMMWHGAQAVVGWLLESVRPHPSTRGGARNQMWWMWRRSVGGDVVHDDVA